MCWKFRNGFDPDQKHVMMEYFEGLRIHRTARFYTPMLLARRFLFVFIILLLDVIGTNAVFTLVIIIQVFYLVGIIYLHPYEETKENIIETMNEAFYVVLLGLMLSLDTQSKWSKFWTHLFINLITLNTILISVILIGK